MSSLQDGGDRYAAALWRLKRRGCLLALVGPVAEETAVRAIDRLLGAPVRERHRLILLTHPDAEDRWSERLPHTDVIDRRPAADGPTDADANANTNANGDSDRGATELRALRDRVEAAVDACRADGSLAAAEFRLVVDSVDALADRYGLPATVEFVTALADLVCEVRGMAAVRVRADEDHLREALAPTVDGRIELHDGTAGPRDAGVVSPVGPRAAPRAPDARPCQRIHLPDVGTSGWVPL